MSCLGHVAVRDHEIGGAVRCCARAPGSQHVGLDCLLFIARGNAEKRNSGDSEDLGEQARCAASRSLLGAADDQFVPGNFPVGCDARKFGFVSGPQGEDSALGFSQKVYRLYVGAGRCLVP